MINEEEWHCKLEIYKDEYGYWVWWSKSKNDKNTMREMIEEREWHYKLKYNKDEYGF